MCAASSACQLGNSQPGRGGGFSRQVLRGKACLLIRKHDHFTPLREIKRHLRALARNHPEGCKLQGHLVEETAPDPQVPGFPPPEVNRLGVKRLRGRLMCLTDGSDTVSCGWNADQSQLFVVIPGNFCRIQGKIIERRGA